jgi:hypothetical protein
MLGREIGNRKRISAKGEKSRGTQVFATLCLMGSEQAKQPNSVNWRSGSLSGPA